MRFLYRQVFKLFNDRILRAIALQTTLKLCQVEAIVSLLLQKVALECSVRQIEFYCCI
ncbi:hypothetical protein [Nostoc sp.]|uniref:hypothetical protein n=1 Tax=Nostoc sp. TaxID=1180 RepID=UPI002FFD2BE7